ncbi:MAG: hypothetical protein KGJ55_05700 [Gammaproteobacteria bacterium]|nr:hypothetical protein [Gammaproteobacteria bacterium]
MRGRCYLLCLPLVVVAERRHKLDLRFELALPGLAPICLLPSVFILA